MFLLAACGGSGDEHPDEIVFRVGATAGLSELVPNLKIAGSSAAAVDLVFDFADAHVDEVKVDGAKIHLKRRSSSPFSAERLAASARSPGLVSARALGSERLELEFQSPAAARASIEGGVLAFDVGPFRIESQERGRARLTRRGKSAIDVIEIVEVSSSDEWRKFMARELDVMSSSPSLYKDQFAGMGSVRRLDIPATTAAALYFNVRDPALADARVRRRIAGGLNRQAIARVASADESSAVAPPVGPAGDDIGLPSRVSLLVIENDSTLLLAASVLRHQLDRLGIAVEQQAMTLDDLESRLDQGRFQLTLQPLPNGPRRFGRFLSPGPDNPPLTGFADPAYDAAVKRGDLAAAQDILDREMPAIVLYERRSFAAIDSRFCGDVTPSDISWRWMADLHLCQNGERAGDTDGETTP